MADRGIVSTAAPATLAILAGGAGARMGRAKGLLTIGGQAILEVLLDRFAWEGPTMLVTAPGREGPPRLRRFGREVVDPIAHGGPLVGVCTALSQAGTELVIVATVDMPGVGPGQLRWLIETLQPGQLGVMGKRSDEGKPQIEPFPSIFRTAALGSLERHLATGKRSVHSILADPRFVAAAIPADWPSSVWTNLNYPADVEAMSAAGRHGRSH